MSFLSDAGNAIGGAADKVAGNELVGKLGEIAGGLGGAGVGGGSVPKGEPKYRKGQTLDDRIGKPTSLSMQSQASGSSSAAPTEFNRTDSPQPTLFVHFARLHDDMSDNFNGGDPTHGLAFRDGLLREAVLLHGFVSSAKAVLLENKNSKGSAAKMLDTAGSLMGGKKAADAGPEQFDPLIAQIQTAIKPINGGSFTYEMVHKAGVDLNEARASFVKMCQTALKPGSGGGLSLPTLPSIPGVSAVAGPIMEIPKYLFKVQDVYLAMFKAAHERYETGIEEVCGDVSIQSITDKRKPTYEVWFAKKADAATAATKPPGSGLLDESGGFDVQGKDLLADAKKKEREFEQEQADKVNSALSNLETQPETGDDCQFKPNLLSAVGVLSAGGSSSSAGTSPNANQAKASDKPKGDELMAQAMATGVGSAMPGFINTVVREMSTVSIEILGKIYPHLLATKGAGDLNAVVLTSVREALSKKIVDVAWGLLAGVLGLEEAPGQNKKKEMSTSDLRSGLTSLPGNVSSLPGDAMSFAKGPLANKAAEMAKQQLTENSKPINGIIAFVASDLATKLTAAKQGSDKNTALSMESFLGVLPMLHATMVRNTVFPLFNLLLDLFGLGDKLAVGAWNPVNKGLGTAGDYANTGNQYKDNAYDAAKGTQDKLGKLDDDMGKLGEGNEFGTGKDNSKVGDKFNKFGNDAAAVPTGAFNDLVKDPQSGSGAGGASMPGEGPLGSARVVAGTAEKVTPGQLASAEGYDKSHQVFPSETAKV